MMHPGLGWCVIERAWRYEAHLGATDLAPASGPVQCLARSSPDVEEHVTIPVAMQKRPGCDYRTWRLCRSRMPTYGHGDTCCPDTATEARRATSICVHFSTSPCTRAHRRSGQTPGHRVVRTTLHRTPSLQRRIETGERLLHPRGHLGIAPVSRMGSRSFIRPRSPPSAWISAVSAG